MEFWQIKSRAFVAGETAAQRRMDRLEAVVSGRLVSRSEHPGRDQQKLNELYLDAVTPKREARSEELEASRHRHNKAFFESLANGKRET